MKILVISQFYTPEPFRIGDICEGLAANGHEVTVLTSLPNYPHGEVYEGYENRLEEYVNGVKVIRCRARPRHKGTLNLGLSYLSYMMKASHKVRKLTADFDIVFVYQLSPVFMGIPAIKYKKKNKVPIYLYCLDVWPESIRDIFKSEKSIFYIIVKKISKYIYGAADLIGVTTKSFIGYLHEKCSVDIEKIKYLPQHAEDIYLNVPIKKSITNDTVNFSYMGNMSISQNLGIFLRAAAKLDLDFSIHFIGNGPAEDGLKRLALDLGLTDKVIFHGRHSIEEMPEFYKAADVCFLSLASDNAIGTTIPGKLQGYMAAGKPVLAAIEGPAEELIQVSCCGICLRPDDVDEVADGMRWFIQNRNHCEMLGKNGRKYFMEHFTKSIFVNKLEKQFEETMARKNNTVEK